MEGFLMCFIVFGPLVAILVVGVIGQWQIECVKRAGEQRKELLDVAFAKRADNGLVAFWSVSQEQHYEALVSFRDPMALYPDPLGTKGEGA